MEKEQFIKMDTIMKKVLQVLITPSPFFSLFSIPLFSMISKICGTLSHRLLNVTLHGKTVNKVNARTRHARTLKQKIRVSTR